MADKSTHISASDLWEIVNAGISQAVAGKDKGIISKDGAAIKLKDDNTVTQSAGMYVQRTANGNGGSISDVSLQHNIKTVRTSVSTSDLIINNHKMNSYAYELTNMKNVAGTAIGNFTVMGTVLVKTYDPNLEKWVLVRRQVRVPLFSNLLDPYNIDDRLSAPDSNVSIHRYKIDKDDGDN